MICFQLCIREERYQEAIETYKKATRIYPEDCDMRMRLATAYYAVKQYSDVEDQLSKVIEVDSSYKPAYKSLFNLLCQLERFDDAIKVYTKAIKHWPRDIELYAKLASIYYKQENFEGTVETYHQMLIITKRDVSIFF